MAAYAALVSLMYIIDDIEHHRSPPISIDKEQVESLTEIVTFLQEFLGRYDFPFDYSDEADPLEMRIVDAAHAAEDVIESHIVDVIKLGASSSSEEVNSREEISCIDFYQDLHQVIEEMDSVKKVAMKINAENAVDHDPQQRKEYASVASLTSSSSSTGQNSSIVVCSDDVLLGIMGKLVAGPLNRQVIPIVGMAGIGKTTLARTVYSKPLVEEYFDVCAWATISQQYDIKEILCEILSEATKKSKEELCERSEDRLGSEIWKYLYGRRFLIVMDDMWSVDAWDKIQRFFPNNENGSRILVTTRLSQLSSQLSSSYSLQMGFLDEATSWDLFSKIVFGGESCPLEMKEVGVKIVENCRGLPLSIVVVGGLLKKVEHTQECWESILKNLTSFVNLENDKHCLRLLKLSYNNLPVYLKPCFLYMGVFEEDYAISVSRLITLWVSEGLIKPTNDKSLETMAQGFFKDLVDRNLILVHKLGNTQSIKLCKIHDLLRDLCLREGRKYGFCHVIGQPSPQGINSQRRVVIRGSTLKEKVFDALQSMSYTRSVICEKEEVPPCQNLGLLRTLHVYDNYPNVSSRDAFVSQCVNLRHLGVKVGAGMSSFLSSINLVWNLHTLIVSCSFRDKCDAPVGIWKMPQLRHIEFNDRPLCLPDPPTNEVVVMENLQILKGAGNFKCGDEVVKRVPNVKKLRIRYDGFAGTDRDDYYCLSNIKCLCKLESLYIYCFFEFRGLPSLHKPTFPHSLKSLRLWMKMDFELDDILEKAGSLPVLQKLRLQDGCFGTGKWEIVEGQFPSLKFLSLVSCRGLKYWTTQESSIFPRLEQLHVYYLGELEGIPCEIGNISTLQELRMSYCSEPARMSVKDIVEEQEELQGELPFRVVVWPSI